MVLNLQRIGGRKRKRSNEKDVDKSNQFIHVRAKRGQATDSHSLAERVFNNIYIIQFLFLLFNRYYRSYITFSHQIFQLFIFI